MPLLDPSASNQLRARLRQEWGVDFEMYYPLTPSPSHIEAVAFHADLWDFRNGDLLLRKLLSEREIVTVLMFGEGGTGPAEEIAVPNLVMEYTGSEQYYTDEQADWLSYASHESSITIAGAWLVAAFQRHWPGCQRNTYVGPYSAPDFRGSECDRKTFTLRDDVRNANYRALISHAARTCHSFSLVLDPLSPTPATLIRLEPWKIAEYESDQWPGTFLTTNVCRVCRYNLCKEAAEVLSSAADHLFGWLSPSLPEDLCFYRANGALFLGTISHERDGFFSLSFEEERHLRTELPHLLLVSGNRN